MRKLLIIPVIFFVTLLHAQPSNNNNSVADSIANLKARASQDSAEKAFFARAMYPLIKSSKWSGVLPVDNVDEKPNVNQRYKILMEVTKGIKDSVAAKDINEAIAEVGRLMNIHAAAGIPKKNMDVVVVAHGGVLKAFYNDSTYRNKYHISNPNMAIFDELLAAGVKFIACGQAMQFFNVSKPEMVPWMKVALSAQTVLTDYQLRGYLLKKIEVDR